VRTQILLIFFYGAKALRILPGKTVVGDFSNTFAEIDDIIGGAMKEREHYTKEFKQGAVRLVTGQGRFIADAARRRL
jgi:hypothetical protein